MPSSLYAFISSSMVELPRERDIVEAELENLLINVWRFDRDAGGQPRPAQQVFVEEIDESHLYVGIFWKKYGKYTVRELELARRLGKSCLIYQKELADGDERDPRLGNLLAELDHPESGLTVRRFRGDADLRESVKADVLGWLCRAAVLATTSSGVVRSGLGLYRRDLWNLLRTRERDQLAAGRAALASSSAPQPLGRRELSYSAAWRARAYASLGGLLATIFLVLLYQAWDRFSGGFFALVLALPLGLTALGVAVILWEVFTFWLSLLARIKVRSGILGEAKTVRGQQVLPWLEFDGSTAELFLSKAAIPSVSPGRAAWIVVGRGFMRELIRELLVAGQ